jgi:hypothetical protein
MTDDIDTSNDFLVSSTDAGDTLAILLAPMGRIPKAKALRLAAWLVAFADPLDEEFPGVLEAVRNT